MEPAFLRERLEERTQLNAFRKLSISEGLIDLCSNDYLGIARSSVLAHPAPQFHGSTGSRLLSGNYELIEQAESSIAAFHGAAAGLIFNSGYDANLGLLSSVPQRGDTIIYDQLSHASIRDGIRLSFATSFSFRHNDMDDLRRRLEQATGNIFVVTESVFSMDGDFAPLAELCSIAETFNASVIVDEAHATGVIGDRGEGLVQMLGLPDRCFARVHTFGKGVGCHGAIVIGSDTLRDYLVNFARPFIYTTALPPEAIAALISAYALFPKLHKERSFLKDLIKTFQSFSIPFDRISSETPIQAIIVPGNQRVRSIAAQLQQDGFDIRPILYPTVPKGLERLRVVLHSFNTEDELQQLQSALHLAK